MTSDTRKPRSYRRWRHTYTHTLELAGGCTQLLLCDKIICLKTLKHVFIVLTSITQNELQPAATYVTDY